MVAGRADHSGDPAGLVARHLDSLQAQGAGDLTDDRVEDLVCRRPFSDARRNATQRGLLLGEVAQIIVCLRPRDSDRDKLAERFERSLDLLSRLGGEHLPAGIAIVEDREVLVSPSSSDSDHSPHLSADDDRHSGCGLHS